jgi:uncharacterized protein (DUF362 family)
MMDNRNSNFDGIRRRKFLKTALLTGFGAPHIIGCSAISRSSAGTALGSSSGTRRIKYDGPSNVSLAAGKDQRKGAFDALKPLQGEIERAINGKQVVIKVNMGQVAKNLWLNATDVNFTRGILDFLKLFYDRPVIIAESTAASPLPAGPLSTKNGFENYGYLPLEKEYNIRLVDLNDLPTTKVWISNEKQHPFGINVINTFLDPGVFMISATRLKQHNNVIATLSMKNIAMAAPINHYLQKTVAGRNEKPFMHATNYRNLSHNMFRLASMGVQPDLAVLDGIVGLEGDGPVRGTPVEGEIVLASTDWLAADRIGVELMGNDYSEVKYLQWCAAAGMGNDDISKMNLIGPDYRNYVITYKLSPLIEKQRDWVRQDYQS